MKFKVGDKVRIVNFGGSPNPESNGYGTILVDTQHSSMLFYEVSVLFGGKGRLAMYHVMEEEMVLLHGQQQELFT